jgi:hypothetical protein
MSTAKISLAAAAVLTIRYSRFEVNEVGIEQRNVFGFFNIQYGGSQDGFYTMGEDWKVLSRHFSLTWPLGSGQYSAFCSLAWNITSPLSILNWVACTATRNEQQNT